MPKNNLGGAGFGGVKQVNAGEHVRVFLKESCRSRSQSGMTIVGVLIATAMICVAAIAVGTGFGSLYSARNRSNASAAARDAEEAMIQSLTKSYMTYVNAQCAPDSLIASGLPQVAIGSLALLTRTKQIQMPSNALASAGADISRCATTEFSVVDPTQASSFYSCYQIVVPQATAIKADKLSFAANKGAFLEIFANIRDFRTDALVSCATVVAANTGFGLEIYYSLHWILNDINGPIYKTKVGSVNVALAQP